MKTYLVMEKVPDARDPYQPKGTIPKALPEFGGGYPITVVKANSPEDAVNAVMKVTRRMGEGYIVSECSFLSFMPGGDIPQVDNEGVLVAGPLALEENNGS